MKDKMEMTIDENGQLDFRFNVTQDNINHWITFFGTIAQNQNKDFKKVLDKMLTEFKNQSDLSGNSVNGMMAQLAVDIMDIKGNEPMVPPWKYLRQ